jgi:hypothetical protein
MPSKGFAVTSSPKEFKGSAVTGSPKEMIMRCRPRGPQWRVTLRNQREQYEFHVLYDILYAVLLDFVIDVLVCIWSFMDKHIYIYILTASYIWDLCFIDHRRISMHMRFNGKAHMYISTANCINDLWFIA